jgi:hypothetical protein
MAAPHLNLNLNNFTLFPKLPVEIRCMIWTAMCEPRAVELEHDEELETFYSKAHSAPYPLALEICQESRNAIINEYPLCFGSIFYPATTRFNFKLDTLYISEELWEDLPNLFSLFRENEINNLQHIALDEFYVTQYELENPWHPAGLRRALKALKALKEVQIVFHIRDMAPNAYLEGCGEDHALVLYQNLPEYLDCFLIDPLPNEIKDGIWDGPYRPIYGWRKCVEWRRYMELNTESGSEFESFFTIQRPSARPGHYTYAGFDESDDSEEGTITGESGSDDVPSDTEEGIPSDATLIAGRGQ